MYEKAKKIYNNLPLVKEYKNCDLWVKALFTFGIGLVLAPLSHSLFWFLFYLVVFEIIWATLVGFDLNTRVVIIVASILGYVLGRLLVRASFS